MPRRVVTSSALTFVLVLAGLAVGAQINKRVPSTDQILFTPFSHEIAMGESVDMRTVRLTPTEVTTARQVIGPDGAVHQTTGLWVLLGLEYEAKDEPQGLVSLQAKSTSGRIYGGFGDLSLSCRVAQPGIPQLCHVAFEVNSDDVAGLVVTVPTGGSRNAESDDLAAIDLGISQESELVTHPRNSVDLVPARYLGGGT